MSRSHSPDRCLRCELHRTQCICTEIHPLAIRSDVSILIHYRETPLTSNTSKLFKLAAPKADLFWRGKKGAELDRLTLKEKCKGKRNIYLFPGEGIPELSSEQFKNAEEKIHWVIPDGNWSQCSKVFRRERLDELGPWEVAQLPGKPMGEYGLRNAPRPGALSTFECLVHALSYVEKPEYIEDLRRVFRLKRDRLLKLRGKLSQEESMEEIS